MLKKISFFLFLILVAPAVCHAQNFVSMADAISDSIQSAGSGKLTIIQDPRIDTLFSRNLAANKEVGGMPGFRIQIYRGSDRNAREDAAKAKARFINEYPDIESYDLFEKPNYFKVRVGNYRTKQEATKALYQIRNTFRDAYIIEEIINFPDLNKQ